MNISNDVPSAIMRAAVAEHADAQTVLRLNGISKSFGENHVLRDVSLTVHKGETVCLLGPSGCGKSTLLRCVNWLEVPDAGTVHVSNQRMGVREGSSIKMSDAELARSRARIGMVFQHFALWPHLTVLQNVMEAPLHVLGRPREEVREEARHLLERVGLAGKMDAFPSRLSGGQKQRVGIARALAMKPDILLFDEPTSALDPMLVGEVLNVMRSLAQEGATMVIVTHEMEFARQVASRIVFMDAGEVIESAPPERFFGAPQTPRARQFLARFRSPREAPGDWSGVPTLA
ncbi:amino acid ABC transporter ATP-binding protein [Paraburkholderia silvatlantica]|uniref:Polar amino acid transport system ATP-binding protein n=1 Tax=Paraburkholderia silvatlantica TaxID=321895 RepID=A0ABR6FUU0_9BURK|nr:amino acid ABC transporter ATP-binding protein [Paraburkholderia silvatlantica]MBB2931181.1 polar amino acid transport system ATP-binding protein [Paraburkholderia silvatlantica]PVY28659.1 amino acid ABC transporter ATP-binding protein (PAAT family) [Paraburkholderia silvatlantica]PXW36296.1 amino acid ABC transporter ATP-binding protein (PAAT family) [Paraburkholderia silvatlantica]